MSKATAQNALHMAGEGVTVTKTSTGVTTLLPAVDYDRLIAIYAWTIEGWADGTGTRTGVKIGQGDDDDKFDFNDNFLAAPGDALAPSGSSSPGNFLGVLSAGQPCILTVTPAVGNGTGGGIIAAVAIAAIPAA
jgi:hypothetical protein